MGVSFKTFEKLSEEVSSYCFEHDVCIENVLVKVVRGQFIVYFDDVFSKDKEAIIRIVNSYN